MTKNETKEISILKSIWRKNEAGKWMTHDMKGIELKPREGFSKDFFKIKNEMVLLTQQPGFIQENFFASLA